MLSWMTTSLDGTNSAMRTSKRYSHAKNVKKNSARHIISRMPRRKYAVVSPMPLMVNPRPLNCLEIYFNKEPVSISKPGSKCCQFDPSRPHHAAILSRMDQKGRARSLARPGVSPTTTHLSTSPMSGRRVSPATSRLRTSPMTSQKWAMCPSCGDSLSRLGIAKDRALPHHQK